MNEADLAAHLYPLTPGRHSEALARGHTLQVLRKLRSYPDLPTPLVEAWMTPLRQAVGSCFATAPAMRIQQEDPAQFLRDLVEISETHQLKRTFGGVEYAVPLCPADQPLLRLWEYTLASFTETKSNFSRWNLYNSLGFEPTAAAGLGPLLQKLIQDELDRTNRQIEALDSQIASLEARRLETRDLSGQRARIIALAQTLAHLPPKLVDLYGALFPAYFQEIYDPEMPDVAHTGRYEDRPAGFRLLYKHGRTAPSTWTLIYTADSFIDALVDFFRATEREIADVTFQEYPRLVTEIIHHLRTPLFLEGAHLRIQKQHGSKARPWSYVSGGSMETLLGVYYGLDLPLPKRERAIESPLDLFLFLLEAMKELPTSSQPFVDDPTRSLLMESPRHAFLFKPGLPPFRDGWLQAENTYTWVREYVIRPQEEFAATQRLTPAMIRHLGLKSSTTLTSRQLYERHPSTTLASRLFSSLPYTSWNDLRPLLTRIFSHLDLTISIDKLPMAEVFSSQEVQYICQQLLIDHFGVSDTPQDYVWQLRQAMRDLGVAYPAPVLFADTNWNWDFFGFLVSPATHRLELWRSDYVGLEAAPMDDWSHWLDGTSDETWVVYSL